MTNVVDDRELEERYPDERLDATGLEQNRFLVDLRDVVKVYKSSAGSFTALKRIDLQVKHGEFVAVVGKSGSGKSTLMNMITGIDRPTSGKVYVNNVALHNLSEGKIAVWRGKTVGIVFQFFQLLPTLTVVENIMLPMDFCHMFTLRERNERANYLLKLVELEDQANKLPSALSGGQQQRVAIARALANDPPIIVADEPTGNLDSKTAAAIFNLFWNLVDDGKTILMVTHDQDMADKVSRTIYLVDGKIVTSEEFRQDRDAGILADDKEEYEKEIGIESPYFEELEQLRITVSIILDDIPNATARMKKEVIQLIPSDNDKSDMYYKVILDEVSYRAKRAEEAGRVKEAKQYWKILMEATE